MPEQETDILIAECRSNNRRAQEQLYRRLYGFAMSIALRYAVDQQEAAAIISQAFVKMFCSISTFDSSKGSIHAWLKTIVIHESLDQIKRRSRFSTTEIETVEDLSIDNAVIAKTDATAIMKLIKQLPPATHAVFVLYAIDGYSHREIAAQLNISEGTSKWHLSEARKTLQQKLQYIK